MVRINLLPTEIKLADPIEKYRQQLGKFAIATEAELEKPELLESRAVAYYQTGQTDEALKDLDRLRSVVVVERQPTILQYRTLSLAKLGKAGEAKKSLTEYLKAEVPVSYKLYVEIQVAAWLGDTDVASRKLETAMSTRDDLDGLYNMACAAALCAQATGARSSVASSVPNQRLTVSQWRVTTRNRGR